MTLNRISPMTKKTSTPHLLEIDESIYEGDEDMLYLLNRLQEAANNPEIHHAMKMEDEYNAIMGKHDTGAVEYERQ